MSFREKTAWVTLVAILIVSLMYVYHVSGLFESRHPGLVLHAIALSVAAFAAIEVLAYVVLRLRNPTEARTPKDELEKLIELKALRIAAYVYIVGSFLAIFITLHVHNTGPGAVGLSVVMAFVIAEIVNYTARIVYYRRHR
jgi:hypothetical protein